MVKLSFFESPVLELLGFLFGCCRFLGFKKGCSVVALVGVHDYDGLWMQRVGFGDASSLSPLCTFCFYGKPRGSKLALFFCYNSLEDKLIIIFPSHPFRIYFHPLHICTGDNNGGVFAAPRALLCNMWSIGQHVSNLISPLTLSGVL